ncbi:Predicted ATPase, nucleotide-binding [Ceraceosorus bombacis]|uniref:Predicted ATPase, nucleotide-binding n=1 Tax=Ceraceosorus bombacis TaxID=401625 RepID=A0A0P1BJ95_9BASI|nr:Predicted ATPase, nucleotide-binding [Ceraceosorus bombacis]
MPRRSGPTTKRRPAFVGSTLVIASGKGGVGKSTVAVSTALSLAKLSPGSTGLGRSLRVGLLDLDIFGPSVPKLMGLDKAGEPRLSKNGQLVPLTNHGIPTMSMGYLLPPSPDTGSASDAPIVWRGLMVQKATQQLLFDVDWRGEQGGPEAEEGAGGGSGLDVLVIDTPPGTGDVLLSLTQLMIIDSVVIVSTPQDVALIDARRGVRMFEKCGVQVAGMALNMSHFETGMASAAPLEVFGSSASFDKLAQELQVPVLGRIPIESSIASGGDRGQPGVLQSPSPSVDAHAAPASAPRVFATMAEAVWRDIQRKRGLGGG